MEVGVIGDRVRVLRISHAIVYVFIDSRIMVGPDEVEKSYGSSSVTL